MNFTNIETLLQHKVKVKNLLPDIGISQARKEIISGLTKDKPRISSKYFYDETGSVLFEEITHLQEYYPTRTEQQILRNRARELMNRNSSIEIIELGSGDCSKISILLDAVDKTNLKNANYIPVDISKSAIENSVDELSDRFPQLKMNGYVADFIYQLDQIPHSEKSRLICFLGSTIGNFSKSDSQEILQNLSKGLFGGDSLLVGFDLVKPEPVLLAAYNDSLGVTEKFNKNILKVVNGIIESDFDVENFEHRAFFNAAKSRIEMHLIVIEDCVVSSPFFEKTIQFKKGSSIHSENSHKYTFETIRELTKYAGLEVKNYFTDSKKWFALVELAKR